MISATAVGGGSVAVTTGSGSAISCGGNAAIMEGLGAGLIISGARTPAGCDKDWPKTTSIPPLTGGSGGLGSATKRTSKANTEAWPAVERISGSRIPLIAAYFNNETAGFEKVDIVGGGAASPGAAQHNSTHQTKMDNVEHSHRLLNRLSRVAWTV